MSAREQGFSLIEVMVALVILALGGLALLNLMQASTRNTVAVQDRALAMLAAENLLNAELLRQDPHEARSGSYELAGATYDWSLQVNPAGDADLLHLTLEIAPQDSEAVLASIETFRRRQN